MKLIRTNRDCECREGDLDYGCGYELYKYSVRSDRVIYSMWQPRFVIDFEYPVSQELYYLGRSGIITKSKLLNF